MTSSRKDCVGRLAPCVPRSLREALYCQINHSEESRNSLAEVMDINPATLSKWGDPQGDERIPEDRLLHLLRLTDDNPAYVKFVAEHAGFIVFDPRKSDGRNLSRMVSEFGDVLKAHDELSAGGWTPEEARKFKAEVDELHAAAEREVHRVYAEAGLNLDERGPQ